MVRSESLQAHCANRKTSKYLDQKKLIKNALKKLKACSRRQIADFLGMETATVSARVYEMIHTDCEVVEVGKFKCPISKKNVNKIKAL